MAKTLKTKDSASYKAWYFDQLSKSAFFHQKLHEWGLIEMAKQIEKVEGEKLEWDTQALGISENAWKKVIHQGIKPIKVFAHPEVLTKLKGSAAYYRMLAMVSQKSMNQVATNVTQFETGKKVPDEVKANFIASHLNQIISHLIEADEKIDAREFDLWRGMAAGSQAQGSWQNAKGSQAEVLIRGMVERFVKEQNLMQGEIGETKIELKNGLTLTFSAEPDLGVFKKGKIQAAVEVKGGIDPAGVLERVGAALKSLRRAKDENPKAKTILIMQSVSFSNRAQKDISMNKAVIDHILMLEELIENEAVRAKFFKLLKLTAK